ncbi:MAG: DUF5668 domain-containing protein [Terracidiphilus sp.]|jgi:hypothetical protein
MNRYIMIHHLRWPAILLLVGTLALLAQLNVIEDFWHWFWPLLLILIGVLKLAERMALASMDGDGGSGTWPYGGTPVPPAPRPETSIVPVNTSGPGTDVFGRPTNGGNQ